MMCLNELQILYGVCMDNMESMMRYGIYGMVLEEREVEPQIRTPYDTTGQCKYASFIESAFYAMPHASELSWCVT